MFDIRNRTALPLASAAGCNCCTPPAKAGEAPAAVVISEATMSDAGTPSPTLPHRPH